MPIRLQTFTLWEGEAPAEPKQHGKPRLGRSLALPSALPSD